MVKISVVMPVYNAERFLKDSVNSILNQTFDDLELICVDDGSSDNSLKILNEFKQKDSRVKVFSLKHQGGGNARNHGLSKISGDYLFHMDADDLLDPNAFEDFYKICEEKDLDFLVFKAINYGVEKDHYFETAYQNMKSIAEKVKDNVFNYKDLGDLLFDFNVSPWCKFYNAEFVKKTNAKFRENSKFHDNQFFWDIIFKARRILFIDKFYYTRKRYNQSLTASGDINHIDIIGVVNDIIKLFIKHARLERYKNSLYNLKVTWIVDRYNQVNLEFKEEFFIKMKEDFEILKNTEFHDLLTDEKRLLFDNVINSKNHKDLALLNKYVDFRKENKESNEKISKIKNWFETLPENYKSYALTALKRDFKSIPDDLNMENMLFIKDITSSNDIRELEINRDISNLKIQFKDKNIDEIIDRYKESQISNYENEKLISDLSAKVNNYEMMLKKNHVEMSRLKSNNDFLIKKNNYLKNEFENKNRFKKLFSLKK